MKRLIPAALARRLAGLFAGLHAEEIPHGVATEATIDVETTIAATFLPDKNGTVIDAGANRGDWSNAILARGNGKIGRLIAVEPQTALLPTLKATADQRFEIVSAAVGKEAGLATLYADTPGSGLASLTQRRLDHVALQMSAQEQVRVITLDELAASHHLERIDILKLDIEGHELDALAGATRLFAEKRIGYVQFEFGGCNIDTRTYLRDFWHFFNDRGFVMGRVVHRGGAPLLLPLPRYGEALERFTQDNYGAWPNDRPPRSSLLAKG